MSEFIFENMEAFYNAIPHPIEIISEAGKIVYTNEVFNSFWGFQPNELKEYNFFADSEVKSRGIQSKIARIFDKKNQVVVNGFVDSLLKSREITLPFIKTTISPLVINKNKYLLLYHEDISEIILNDLEIKKAREGNREAERLKDTFLNVLSHELRTPLNIVLGYSSIIKESMKDKINIEDRIYLDNLYSGSERLFKSITQMLEFAQIEAGSYKMNIEAVDLIPIILNSIDLIKDDADLKQLGIKTVLKKNSIFVNIDTQSTDNALNNILSNAVKFTKQGFIEIEVDIIEDREVAICKIKDTGIGISSEYLDHLFRPFSQEDLNIGRNFEGNGLGLALAKRYIEKMGGSLLVDSIKGVGSNFTFTLPLAQMSHKKDRSSSQISELKKIFMLDSQRESLDLISAFLKYKYKIDSSSFNSFNTSLINNDYELIIFDINQNTWDEGLNICKDIKNEYSIPIIILSSEFLEEKINQYILAGADKFLIKPFSKTELIKAIDHFTLLKNR